MQRSRVCWIILVSIGLWTSNAQECGRPPLQSRIVGGYDASEGHWPWQVDIQSSTGHVCGGTLISESWVLSAAHCFPRPSETSDYIIYAGRLNLHGWNTYETSHKINDVIVPFGYTDPQLGQDIALVRLANPVTWSDHIQPVCLPSSDVSFSGGTECTITGWGEIRDGGKGLYRGAGTWVKPYMEGMGRLQQLQVPIIDQRACQDMFQIQPTEEVNIRYDMICAGFKQGGKDSCQGDSGGPLVCQMPSGNWVQAGIVSFGLGCAQPNRPGVYARVSAFSSFIQSNIKGLQLYSTASQNWAGWLLVFTRTVTALILVQLLR